MNALVVYDSVFGNTEKIALKIAEGIGTSTKTIRAQDLNIKDMEGKDLIIVGSPVHGGRATASLLALFEKLEEGSLKGAKVSAFDTRYEKNKQNLGLRTLMNVIGFAAEKIVRTLSEKGGISIIEPEGFIVEGQEGPLKEGELERAKEWGSEIAKRLV